MIEEVQLFGQTEQLNSQIAQVRQWAKAQTSSHLHKRHVEFLALPMLLHSVGKTEGIVEFKSLENIQTTA